MEELIKTIYDTVSSLGRFVEHLGKDPFWVLLLLLLFVSFLESVTIDVSSKHVNVVVSPAELPLPVVYAKKASISREAVRLFPICCLWAVTFCSPYPLLLFVLQMHPVISILTSTYSLNIGSFSSISGSLARLGVSFSYTLKSTTGWTVCKAGSRLYLLLLLVYYAQPVFCFTVHVLLHIWCQVTSMAIFQAISEELSVFDYWLIRLSWCLISHQDTWYCFSFQICKYHRAYVSTPLSFSVNYETVHR